MTALYGRCYDCKLAFGESRPDGTEVTDSSDGDGQCSRCAPCKRECACESEEAHDAAEEEVLEDFLRNPGDPPTGWTAERIERAWSGIKEARNERGIK